MPDKARLIMPTSEAIAEEIVIRKAEEPDSESLLREYFRILSLFPPFSKHSSGSKQRHIPVNASSNSFSDTTIRPLAGSFIIALFF